MAFSPSVSFLSSAIISTSHSSSPRHHNYLKGCQSPDAYSPGSVPGDSFARDRMDSSSLPFADNDATLNVTLCYFSQATLEELSAVSIESITELGDEVTCMMYGTSLEVSERSAMVKLVDILSQCDSNPNVQFLLAPRVRRTLLRTGIVDKRFIREFVITDMCRDMCRMRSHVLVSNKIRHEFLATLKDISNIVF